MNAFSCIASEKTFCYNRVSERVDCKNDSLHTFQGQKGRLQI